MADAIDPAAIISRMSEPQLGPDPRAQAAAQAAAKAAEEKAEGEPTAEEAAVSAGAPKDEGGKMGEDAILYEIGGRKLTPQQISSTFDRYRDLNYKQQEYADLHKVAEIAMRSGMGKSPSDVARVMAQLLAGQKNAQMGGQDERPNETKPAATDDELSKWEEENAAKLPPGYRELHQSLGSMGQGIGDLKNLLVQVLQQAKGASDAGARDMQQAREERGNAIKAKISNNLEALAGKLGLTDQHAGDFMVFAGERGYTLDDFIDPRLAASVMQDFKANLDSPEMERLRAIAQRRQAFTGTMGSPASQGRDAPATEGGDPRLAALTDRAMGIK